MSRSRMSEWHSLARKTAAQARVEGQGVLRARSRRRSNSRTFLSPWAMLGNNKFSVDPGSITIFSHPRAPEARPGDLFDDSANLNSGCFLAQFQTSPFRTLTYAMLIGSAFLFTTLLVVLLK